MTAAEVVGTIFVLLGALTALLGAVGVVRFPCFYTRLHAAGKGDTLGQGLVLTGLFVVACFGDASGNDALKLLLIAFFVFVLNSTATHALARAGWIAALKPWTRRMEEVPEPFVQFEGQMTDADRQEAIVPVQAAADDEGAEDGGATP